MNENDRLVIIMDLRIVDEHLYACLVRLNIVFKDNPELEKRTRLQLKNFHDHLNRCHKALQRIQASLAAPAGDQE